MPTFGPKLGTILRRVLSERPPTVICIVLRMTLHYMALPLRQALPVAVSLFPLQALGQSVPLPPQVQPSQAVEASLSPECRVPASELYALASLQRVRTAFDEKRP